MFLQNRYLFGDRDLSQFPRLTRWRIRLERAWFSKRLDAERMVVYVQTQSMAAELLRETGIEARVFPFAPPATDIKSVHTAPEFDFIYVASGEPHKNHLNLLRAWEFLGSEGLFPSLCLTLDLGAHPQLARELARVCGNSTMRITNLGAVANTEMSDCYQRARALIYPSTLESFGLPLIEASRLGMPILASEMDYVRDVSLPAETFDPESPLSIARAVKRFLLKQSPQPTLFSSDEFVQEIHCPKTPCS